MTRSGAETVELVGGQLARHAPAADRHDDVAARLLAAGERHLLLSPATTPPAGARPDTRPRNPGETTMRPPFPHQDAVTLTERVG